MQKPVTFKNLAINILLITTISIISTGCGLQPLPGVDINEASIYHDKSKNNGIEIIHFPKFNEVKIVEVGENLYEKINQKSHDTYKVKLLENTSATLALGGSIRTNKKLNEYSNADLYHWQGKKALCINAGIYMSKSTYICLVDINDNGYFSIATYSYKDTKYPLKNNAKYHITPKKPTYNSDSFKYVALYQGKVDNRIKISYREFKDNMARAAFTQNIEYELDADGTAIIGFKGLRIKVLKATNMDIEYKVLKDYK